MSQRMLSAEPEELQSRGSRGLRLKLFSGTGNPGLAQEIAAALEVSLAEMSIFRFADGEVGVRIDRKSTRLNSSHIQKSRMPSSA